jgi:catechol-2,3-dioxygenase
MDKIYCPLKQTSESNNIIDVYCDKEHCAWWCQTTNCCTMISISVELESLRKELHKENTDR